jgi:membrane-bound metal-dependent hydrolase YbcI (DUF457 family)
MANAAAHRLGAAAIVGGIALAAENKQEESTAKPLIAGGLACLAGTLPDILEPACHPNHRQFFHSLAFAGMVGHGVYKAWQWKPESKTQEWLRIACMAAGGAYLVHLAMDATTTKGLPIV